MEYTLGQSRTPISMNKLDRIPRCQLLMRSIVSPLLCAGFTIPASAQITTGGDGTIVNQSGNTFNITGGTQPTGSGNLFHSFGTFGLQTNQTASFQPGVSVTNILGRVTGGTYSSIDGKIQVTGSANLYLMNPAGIVFGKNASLDVNGAFTATAANAIGFGNSNWFKAFGTTNDYPTLTGTPTDFAFTAVPGSIFNAANLTSKAGNSITLVGGTIISTGNIKTSGGNITIATAPGGKYVRISSDGSILALDLPIASAQQIDPVATTFSPKPFAELVTGSGIDLTATAVKIEGNGFVLTKDDPIIPNTTTSPSQYLQISGGDIVLNHLNTSNPGKGGDIRIESSSIIHTGDLNSSSPNTSNVENKGGAISIQARDSILTGRIDSSTRPSSNNGVTLPATGGNVTLTSKAAYVLVDSIDTRGATASGTANTRGGDLTVNSSWLFRATKLLDYDTTPAFSTFDPTANGARYSVISINTGPFGKINITHGGNSFVTGAKVLENDPSSSSARGQMPPTAGFTFAERESGSLGLIVGTQAANGSLVVAYTNGSFKAIDGSSPSLDGFQIKSVPLPTAQDPVIPYNPYGLEGLGGLQGLGGQSGIQVVNQLLFLNPNTQVSGQKSKHNCIPSFSSIADPCQSVVGKSPVLQILNSRK
jgi:filamentous hemagglutinin family protein